AVGDALRLARVRVGASEALTGRVGLGARALPVARERLLFARAHRALGVGAFAHRLRARRLFAGEAARRGALAVAHARARATRASARGARDAVGAAGVRRVRRGRRADRKARADVVLGVARLALPFALRVAADAVDAIAAVALEASAALLPVALARFAMQAART